MIELKNLNVSQYFMYLCFIFETTTQFNHTVLIIAIIYVTILIFNVNCLCWK